MTIAPPATYWDAVPSKALQALPAASPGAIARPPIMQAPAELVVALSRSALLPVVYRRWRDGDAPLAVAQVVLSGDQFVGVLTYPGRAQLFLPLSVLPMERGWW